MPVLVDEVLTMLAPSTGSLQIDATVGGGGHTERILEATDPDGRLLGLDADPAAIARVRARLARFGDRRGSFRELWRASGWPPAFEVGEAGLPDARFVQANLSTSAAGVLRGLHLHRRQLDHWIVASGRAAIALVDVRPLLDGSGLYATAFRAVRRV